MKVAPQEQPPHSGRPKINTGIVEQIAALWEQLAENARKRGEGERARWMQEIAGRWWSCLR